MAILGNRRPGSPQDNQGASGQHLGGDPLEGLYSGVEIMTWKHCVQSGGFTAV